MWSTNAGGRFAAIMLTLLVSPAIASDSTLTSAELNTYQREDGQTFFALSLTPPEDAGDKSGARDVVILFDTSASQSGAYRDTAFAAVEECIAKLDPQDRVQLVAADLEARPITPNFVAANSKELHAALNALRRETPLGSTDMEHVLRSVIKRFDEKQPSGRTVLYVGDGLSSANLLGTDSFRQLVETLVAGRISVSSYAIGPKRDGELLAALANHTGGNLYFDEPMVWANEAEDISEERAQEENLRRGAEVGANMADWTRAAVLWPSQVTWPEALGEVYPKTLPPLRTDRDTVVVGATSNPLDKPIEIQISVSSDAGVSELKCSAAPHAAGESHAFLAQVVEMAKANGGAMLTTVGSAGLAETGRVIEANVDGLTDLAERAIATGDVQTAQVAAQAVLTRDPGNVKAKTVQRGSSSR